MEKKDLKTGMIAKTRRNGNYIVLLDCNIKQECEDVFVGDNGFMRIRSYKNNLTYFQDSGYDIMKIFKSNYFSEVVKGNDLTTVWARVKPIPELTMQEVIEKIGYEIKIKK